LKLRRERNMSKFAYSTAFVLALASAASAQDSLLPTYINDSAEITATGRLGYFAGEGSLTNPAFDIDFEDTIILAELRAAIGIGGRFEIEAAVPFAFSGSGEADESNVELEIETAGMGDMSLDLNYAIIQESKSSPQIMAGLVMVLPVGNDDFGVPEIRIGGVQVQDGEEAGLGEGVFKAGLQVGVSKKLTGAHVYGLVRFIAATQNQEEDDVEIDRPEVFTVVAGAMVPLGSTSNLDLRLNVNFVGDEVEDDDTFGETTEEAHFRANLDAFVYFNIGDTATIILGGNIGMTQDHAIDEEAELDLEEVFTYGLSLGLHLRFGGADKKD
jgi:hypothetical protein